MQVAHIWYMQKNIANKMATSHRRRLSKWIKPDNNVIYEKTIHKVNRLSLKCVSALICFGCTIYCLIPSCKICNTLEIFERTS